MARNLDVLTGNYGNHAVDYINHLLVTRVCCLFLVPRGISSTPRSDLMIKKYIQILLHKRGGVPVTTLDPPHPRYLPPSTCTSNHSILINLCSFSCSWEEVVENSYALHLGSGSSTEPADAAAVERLRQVPPNWSLDHDEDLAHFLCCHVETDNENLGSIKNYVESVDVSTFSVGSSNRCASSTLLLLLIFLISASSAYMLTIKHLAER